MYIKIYSLSIFIGSLITSFNYYIVSWLPEIAAVDAVFSIILIICCCHTQLAFSFMYSSYNHVAFIKLCSLVPDSVLVHNCFQLIHLIFVYHSLTHSHNYLTFCINPALKFARQILILIFVHMSQMLSEQQDSILPY